MKEKIRLNSITQKAIRMFAFIPRGLRVINPGYSYCEKCGLPWNWCKSKIVDTSKNSGTFATCDICWNNSTLQQLKQYYTNVYKKQCAGIYGTDYTMGHTLDHLLQCVEDEYNKIVR